MLELINQATGPSPSSVVYVCHADQRPVGMIAAVQKLTLAANIYVDCVDTVGELLQKVGRGLIDPDLIIIDHSLLTTPNPHSSVFDIINTLNTLLKYQRSEPVIGPTKPSFVAVGIDDQVATQVIRELLTISTISRIYPSGPVHTLVDKVTAIQELLRGIRHMPAPIKDRIVHRAKQVSKQPIETIALTPRQQQIFDLVTTRGASNKTIANTLHITDSTVKLHMTAILKKCGVRTRTQLAVFTKQPNVPISLLK